jgi:RNA polymerase sigma-70 factor (ECF subfamily)
MAEGTDDVERAFRAEAGRVLATVARLVGDLGQAEDAVQEAYLVAVERWPRSGIPDRPGAWLTTVARNRALDRLRREANRGERERAAALEAVAATPPILHPVEDDRLQLLFTCCHPALAPAVRVPLALRFVCGLRVAEIARLLLEGEAAVAKRLQRAKTKVRTAAIPLRMPGPALLGERVPAVLECVYLLFTEGYASTAGDRLIRDELCDEAVQLARLLVGLRPDDPGAAALLSLLLLQDSRRDARLDGDGRIVLLADQDRRRWDRSAIDEAMRHLDRASSARAMTAAAAAYVLQAAVAAEHARAATWESTDWRAIVSHYEALARVSPSPVVLLNRAVAVSFADGPATALPLLERLATDPRLAGSHLVPATLAELHERLGQHDRAEDHCRRALELATTAPERELLARRLADLAAAGGAPADGRVGPRRPAT